MTASSGHLPGVGRLAKGGDLDYDTVGIVSREIAIIRPEKMGGSSERLVLS